MATIWTLARKELRLLVRDRRAALILLVLPLLFILVLGLLLGESFGRKSDEKVRVSIVDLDEGSGLYPGEPWSRVVQRDLAETAGIRLEVIANRAEAERLISEHHRAAVLIFEPTFSQNVNRCSFLADGINPFHRDGVYLERVGATLLTDTKQPAGAAVIEQVAQVTLLRVILPWMIGKAFERLSEERFIDLLANQVYLPVPPQFRFLFKTDREGKAQLQELLRVAAGGKPEVMSDYKQRVGKGVQAALQQQFEKYNLTGKTWAALTKAQGENSDRPAEIATYQNQDGSGLLRRGAQRYQLLVPSYTVMFAFFLVMTVGWVFVAERRQGTLKRLRAAPVSRWEILLGKLLPTFLVSLMQGVFLLLAGKLVFGMRWGPDDWPLWQQAALLVPVVVSTSLAAIGLSLLVAALARSEIQVAIYGAVPVLVMALIGGCVLPRELMPEQTQQFSLLTPHGWALDAYRELLDPDPTARPNLAIVGRACAVLTAFGTGFLGLAGCVLRLD